MKKLTGFFRLVRMMNLIFIMLTQFLFYHFIILTSGVSTPRFGNFELVLIILSSVLIAAGGNVINDYFDFNIDQVNKPEKVVVGKIVKRRWAILLHLLMSASGIILTAFLSYRLNNYFVFIVNIIVVFLLLFYSSTLKKKSFYGNLLVSALTAWVILVLCFYEVDNFQSFVIGDASQSDLNILKYGLIYAFFAFLISLIREVVKDIEDMNGDLTYGCRTLPISIGISKTKRILVLLFSIIILSFALFSILTFIEHDYLLSSYIIFALILPMIFLAIKTNQSFLPSEFHAISTWLKLVMLFGVFTMFFIHH